MCTVKSVCGSVCVLLSLCAVQYVYCSVCVRFSMCTVQSVCGSPNGSVTIAVTKQHYALHCRYPQMYSSLPLPHNGTQHAVYSNFKPTEYFGYVARNVKVMYTAFSSQEFVYLFPSFLQ